MWLRKSRELKWCCACHSRLGSHIRMESATPIHSHWLRRKRRASVNSTPATMASTKKPIVHLDCIPKPMLAPMAIHQRGSPDLSSRTMKYAVDTHARQSNATYIMRYPPQRQKGRHA